MLVAIALSVWLMARASPTYCSIIVLSLAAVMIDVHLHPGSGRYQLTKDSAVLSCVGPQETGH